MFWGSDVRLKYVVGAVVIVLLLSFCSETEGSDKPSDHLDSSQPVVVSDDGLVRTPAKAKRPTATHAPTKKRVAKSAALVALASLPVKGRAPMTGYDRARFGQAWLDADRSGCDTRNDVLAEQLTKVVLESNGCVVASGVYADPYTGTRIDYRHGDGTLIDVDHVISLGNAWVTGAFRWDIKKRAAFANDPLNLLPADAGANRQKRDGDAATWLPPNKSFRCAYVARQVAAKAKYKLWVTAPEKAAISQVLSSCPRQKLPWDHWHAPIRVDHNITDPSAPVQSGGVQPLMAGGASGPFANCTAARAAGDAPVRRGDPGYGRHLDRDGDGVGCE